MSSTRGRASTTTAASIRLFVPVLVALEFFSGLVQGWIVPLLGEIGRVFQVPGGATSWVLAVGLLSSAVSVPLIAMLGDRFGQQRLLVVSVALAAAGSLLVAFAPAFAFVLLGAAVQGPVAAFLPLAMALLKAHRQKSANKDIGLMVGALTFGVAAGSVLGGVAMDVIGSLLWVQLIPALGIALFVPLVRVLVPEGRPDASRMIDWKGAALLGAGLVGVMYGLSEAPQRGWLSEHALIPLVVGILALVLFLRVERRAPSPLVDLPAIRSSHLGNPIFIGFLVAVTMFGNQSPPVLFLSANPAVTGYGAGLSTTGVGIVLAVSAGSLTLGSFSSFLLAKVLGRSRALVLACLLSAAALVCMAFVPSSVLLFTLWLAIGGIGMGVVLGVLPGVVIERAPVAAPASASGVYNTARTIGGSLAGAFVASTTLLVTSAGTSSGNTAPSMQAFQIIWMVFAALNVAGAVCAVFISRPPAAVHAEAEFELVEEAAARR
ncbi:MFS transporter [Arthrobacter crystallopoietes]|uniref:MFS transporter n=1 Tax=Crystallibacter crystallopoietes TaxID=37928 RepID=UPI001FC9AE9D|nr:MFS transporter [Arthrobacter crystallopoietes]